MIFNVPFKISVPIVISKTSFRLVAALVVDLKDLSSPLSVWLPGHSRPLLVEFPLPYAQQSLREAHISFGTFLSLHALHFWNSTLPLWLFLPLQTPVSISTTQQALYGFLLPVPMSENWLQALSQEDLRAYLFCSLLSGIMVCTAYCSISKNSSSLYFVQFHCSSLNLVIVTPPSMKAESQCLFGDKYAKLFSVPQCLISCSVFVLVLFSWSNLCNFNFLTEWSNSSGFSNLNNYSLPMIVLPDLANNNVGHTVKLKYQINNE